MPLHLSVIENSALCTTIFSSILYLRHMVVEYDISKIHEVAKQVLAQFANRKVWAFYAPMGAGKTTFIHALCDILKVQDVVSSPTFAIINEYTSPEFTTIYHMDWYRLKGEEEAINAGVEDALINGDLCLVEWPEKATDLLPDDVLNITIELLDIATRRMTIY
jgi:tRNA threonylcarbamoyladenosine biosynthesis protein TsaE